MAGYIAEDAGAPEQASRAYRFALVTDDLRELARYAAPHQHRDEVAHLRKHIGTLLRRTDNP